MKKYSTIFVILFFANLTCIKGQVNLHGTDQILKNLFDRLAIAADDSARIRLNDSIDIILSGYVRSDSVFIHRFRNIRYLGQIQPADSRVKIITWNLVLRNSKSRYYCYFINKSGKSKNIVYKLTSDYKEAPINSDIIYSGSDWYGALYYDIRPIREGNKLYWIVLGVDYGNPSITRKIIDVVEFGSDGTLTFGRKIFSKDNGLSYRVVLEYSSEAVVSLKFISDKIIAFDHLVPVSAGSSNNREMYAPEFSYDGYSLDKGLWKYKENIDLRLPPHYPGGLKSPSPVLQND